MPHFDRPGLVQPITFRLEDSLPSSILQSWRDSTDADRRRKAEAYLDAGHGNCHLRDERIARLVQDALLHFDARRYHLLAWAVMPNHVHAIIEVVEGHPVASVVQSWKSFTAKGANDLLDRIGPFWQADYHDRFLRDADHLDQAIAYVHHNSVKAGLVANPAAWTWSSAAASRALLPPPSP